MRYIVLIIAICALIIGVLFLLGPAEGKTIIVDDDWPGADHCTISAAIAAASAGDTVRVYDGTYNEANRVSKPLDLIGNGTTTVIYGEKMDHVFGFDLVAGNTNVSGFHFYDWWPTHHYGGVGVYSDGNRIFNNSFYSNNRAVFLGGCRDNLVFNNTFDNNYYGLMVYENSHDCTISFNTFTRSYYYGILYSYSTGLDIFSNAFVNFTFGAMAVTRSSDVSVSFNMFDVTGTTSGRRLGAVIYEVDGGEVHNNTFIGLVRALTAVGTTDLRVENNTVLGGVEGLYFGRLWSGQHQLGAWCNGTMVRNNNIIGSSVFGANVSFRQVTPIDARSNWWGHSSGPYHPFNNSGGAGANVTDQVTFDGWLARMVSGLPPVAHIHAVSPRLVNEGDPVLFFGECLARNETVELVWSSSIDGEIHRGTDVAFSRTDLSPGTHTITLKAKDSYGRWSSEASRKLVVNGRPTASIESISPPLVNDGETVSFTGVAFDHENDVRQVVWESDIDGVLSTDLEFETSALSNGTHVITLRAVDGYGLWSEGAIGEVIVNGRPRASIVSVEHPLVNEGETVILRGGYVDHEDGAIEFWWGSDIDGALSDQMLFHTAGLSNGTHTITFRVKDDFQVWSDDVTTTVVVNGLPRARIESMDPDPAVRGETVTLRGSAVDHEDTILCYEWTSDIDGVLGEGEEVSITGLSAGTHLVTFRVMDGHRVWSQPVVATLRVDGRPTAWIVADGTGIFNEGDIVHLEGGFADPEGDVRAYLWESDTDGEVGSAWNLTSAALSNGSHTISFRVMDGVGLWSDPATIIITVNGLPRCRILSTTAEWVEEGQVVELSGSFEDHEDDLELIEWSSDRDGVLGNGEALSTGGLSNGTHVIALRARDGHGVWSEPATRTVRVNGRPRARIGSVVPESTMEGQRVHFSGSAVDDLAVLEYLWTSSIDGDLSSIAVFSTEGLSPGVHTITFTVADNRGTWSDPTTTTITVEAIVLSVGVEAIQVPDVGLEGFELVLGCTLVNTGNVPALGLSVRFHAGDHVVGTVDLDGPVHPDGRRTVEVSWLPVPGEHVVLVEVFQHGLPVCSGTSDVILRVGSNSGPDGPPMENEVPGGAGGKDGDMDGNLFLMVLVVAASITVAVVYMIWTRFRAVTPADWRAIDRDD